MDTTGACRCKEGFFTSPQNGLCLSCDKDCQSCQKAGACSSCKAPAKLGTTRCLTCAPTEFMAGDTCQSCSSQVRHCSKCEPHQQQVVCSACQSGFKLNSQGFCSCPEDSYLDSARGICTRCPSTCSSCSNDGTCTACADPAQIVIEGKCAPLVCPAGTFRNTTSGQCKACAVNC